MQELSINARRHQLNEMVRRLNELGKLRMKEMADADLNEIQDEIKWYNHAIKNIEIISKDLAEKLLTKKINK